MFFLARSVFCIGLVAYLLPASQDPASWPGLADTAQSIAVSPLRALCTTNASSCEAAGAGVAKLLLSGSLAHVPKPSKARSLDTLQAADVVPAWRGPAPRS